MYGAIVEGFMYHRLEAIKKLKLEMDYNRLIPPVRPTTPCITCTCKPVDLLCRNAPT